MSKIDFSELLKPVRCGCGKIHTCAIRHIEIGSGAIRKLEPLTEGYRHILLVADENTYAVCGKQVKQALGDRLEQVFVYQREGILVPDETAAGEMEQHLTERTDLIVGVGSGVIQDLCKYVSFMHKLPYYIVATAPSMDGYASVGAAMIWNNMKVTFNCHTPQVLIGDVDILKDAPMEMIRAGYGDILGKYSCLNDWKLSYIVNGEYFCQYVHDLMMDMVVKTQDLGEQLQNREPAAIETLMEALAGAGVAMAMVGNSRPASGSEHHMSHYFEITGLVHNTPYLMHGIDVVCSAVCTQQLREALLQHQNVPARRVFDREEWEREINRIYGAAAPGVIGLQDKLGWYRQNRYAVYADKWDAIREVLAQTPSAETMEQYINSVGLKLQDFTQLYGAGKIRDGIAYAKDLKDRYSVLWLYYEFFR